MRNALNVAAALRADISTSHRQMLERSRANRMAAFAARRDPIKEAAALEAAREASRAEYARNRK